MSGDRVLIVDDEVMVRQTVRRGLEAAGYVVEEAESCRGAEDALRRAVPDLAVLDYELGDGNALTLLPRLRAVDAELPVVILTGHATIDLAVRAIQDGADHFLTKPVELSALRIVVSRIFEQRRARRRTLARQAGRTRPAIDPFASTNPAILRLADEARRVADSDAAVLIQGETGTGKGVLARWIHQNGPRAPEAFVPINCAGLPLELLESELFGHIKGAFTGAATLKVGLLEVAHHGTVFLDEIGDVDPAIQPRLLKALDEKQIRRLGDVTDRPVDMRLVVATHQDLTALVRAKRFRSDLYFRISTVPLTVPPLRERVEDIPALADRLVADLAADLGRPATRIAPEAMRLLQAYSWPGNIRELRNVIERALFLGTGAMLEPSDLRFEALAAAPHAAPVPAQPADSEQILTLKELERRHIERVLRLEGGLVGDAAKRLGMARSSLYQKIKEYGIIVSKV